MEFDIQYLLLLQELRNATGGIFDEFFNAITKLAVDIMPFLPYIVFWRVDKKWGYRFMSTLLTGELVNGIIKLTVCAYRPWIRSDLINPAGDSKKAATGYSFPSGHSTSATATYGTTFVWQKGKRRWLSVVCAVLLLLTMFSRNFLGVHTPQDVIVGFLISAILIFIIGNVQPKLEGNERLLDILTLVGIIAVIITILYITLKPYPMDYVDGVLLVDPQVMMKDTFKACGGFLGFVVGSYIERHYIHYEIPVGAANLPILACVGFGIMLAWKNLFSAATIELMFGSHIGILIARFIMVAFALVIWPLVIRKFTAQGKEKATV